MLLRSPSGLWIVGVPAAAGESLTVTGEDGSTSSTAALPGEPDPAQLRAAENLGFFSYPDAADSHRMKGQAA